MLRKCLISMAAGWLALSAAAQTVTVALSSSRNGQTVPPGTSIDWTITLSVSTLDNSGLALICADLTQDAANASLFDIPPASGVPSGMSNFSRPNGISNPGESNPTTGYPGVQRGTAGAKNLVQIGGGQNNFGVATSPGTGIAENANLAGGVGQSGSVTVASGTFIAPAPNGLYTFYLDGVIANVLTQLNSPPNPSAVDAATVVVSADSFSFTVAGTSSCDPCDTNCDGSINGFDIGPFVALLNSGGGGGCAPCSGDADGNGSVNGFDIQGFVDCLNNP